MGHTFAVYREAVVAGPGPAPTLPTMPELARAFAELEVIAPSAVSVVLHGEVGTGEEVLARAVHRMSRRPGAFVAVHCGALPATLLESELSMICTAQ